MDHRSKAPGTKQLDLKELTLRTLVESGALDIRTDRVGTDTMCLELADGYLSALCFLKRLAGKGHP